MLSSPGSSIDEMFAPNEIILNSPFDDLIREVSVSPTEELLGSTSTTVTSPNPVKKTTTTSNKKSRKRTKKNITPSKKKKTTFANNVQNLKPVPTAEPYIIKVEPMGNDPPVISIPDMDFLEPEV